MIISSKAFENCCLLSVIEFTDTIDDVVNISILPECNLPNEFHIVIVNSQIKDKFKLFKGINFSKIISKNQDRLQHFKATEKYANIYLAVLYLKQIDDNECILTTIDYLMTKYGLDIGVLENTKEFIEV